MKNKKTFKKRNVSVNEKALLTSYKVSYKIARCKKPHIIGEELILTAAIEIVENMFGDNFAKELQAVPLSNDTVSRRIDDFAEDVEQQLFGKLCDKLFSIQLEEVTDSNRGAHSLRMFDFGMANIEWKNCVGICTDGARTTSGRFESIQELVKQKSLLCIWTHCMIHKEALTSKEMSSGLNIVLTTVVTEVKLHKNETPKIRNLLWTLQRHECSAFIVAILQRKQDGYHVGNFCNVFMN
ncbi:protein FAM200A [Trichonephila clavipes]|nr:protein FAM200A [Trichonephila clavipes]